MKLEEAIRILKEIKEGKEGQMIPYDLIKRSFLPIQNRACVDAVIYLLENLEQNEK